MKIFLMLTAVLLIVGCQTKLTPEEEKKLERMDKAMNEGSGNLGESGVIDMPVDGGHDPASPAIIDGSIEL